jgi:gliding motility-associated-like protein
VFSEPGYYYLESINSCGNHVWDFYYDARPCDIDMPNVFTPNGDLANGIFGPLNTDGTGFNSFNMKLFNRWGNLMFESNDISKGWDGRSTNGQFAEDGVYFYVIEAKDVEDKILNKQGFFHLVSE